MSKKIVRHIPTQSCFYTEEDGITVIISGVAIQPKIDGKIFWEYVDKYENKIVTAANPFIKENTNE